MTAPPLILLIIHLIAGVPDGSQLPNLDWSFLDNGMLKIGVARNWGSAIAYLSPSGSNVNLINHYDLGREVQMSYFFGRGQEYPGIYWPKIDGANFGWNPVQAGDAGNNPSTTLEFRNDGSEIFARIRPKDWALGNYYPPPGKDADVIYEERITLENEVAHAHFRCIHEGQDVHGPKDGEVPAGYFIRELTDFVSYAGERPWTGEPLQTTRPAGQAIWQQLSENWGAFANRDGWGVGLFVPGNTTYGNIRRLSGMGGETGDGIAIFIPHRIVTFAPGTIDEYDVYLTVGTILQIRERFSAIQRELKGDGNGPFASEFSQLGNSDKWTALQDIRLASFQSLGGELFFTAAGPVPTLALGGHHAAVNADRHKLAVVRLWTSAESRLSFSFLPLGKRNFPDDCHLEPVTVPGNAWQDCVLDLSAHGRWQGTVAGLKLALQAEKGQRFAIEFVRLAGHHIELQAQRREAGGWLITRGYCELTARIRSAVLAPAIERFIILRQTGVGAFVQVGEISAAAVSGGAFTYYDRPLEDEISCTYRVTAVDSDGQILGFSSEETIEAK